MLKLSSVGLLSILLVPVFNLPASAQTNSFTTFQNILPQAAWNENWRRINEQQQQERYGNTNNNSAPRFRSPNASSSSTSQLTPEQIRKLAKEVKSTLGPTVVETFCKTNGTIEINGRPISSSEMSMYRNELVQEGTS